MKSKRIGDAGIENFQANGMVEYGKVKSKLDALSTEMDDMRFMGSAADGNIQTVGTGAKRMLELIINEEYINKTLLDEEFLKEFGVEGKNIVKFRIAFNQKFIKVKDNILVSTNNVIQKIDDYTDKQIDKITKGVNIPGFSGF